MSHLVRKWFGRLDWTLICTLLLLALFSCVALYTTTYGKTGSDVPKQIVPKQILFEVLGLITMIVTANFDYRVLRTRSRWIYAISVFLLVIVFGMPRRFGAHSWIPLGLFAFQPSEFAKLGLMIAVATYMAKIDELASPNYGWRNLLAISGMFIVPFGLTLKEPALGQSLVLFAIVVFMYWIPNQWTDFIFTAIAEQFGFIGSAVLILTFLILLYRLTRMAMESSDLFGTYLILGIIGMFGFQVFENIGQDMYLSPATGITLPFISYGGSSLIINYMAIGFALSVYRRHKSMRFTSSTIPSSLNM